jgi:predicted lipid-binding transport protein (Tim44 family)
VSVTGQPLAPLNSAAPGSTATWTIPADFDVDAFLRSAKVYFVRLQAAWDAADLADLREFTTPEMFAEIKVDLSERGAAKNETDVVAVDAQMLGIEEQGSMALASVRFTGSLREAPAPRPNRSRSLEPGEAAVRPRWLAARRDPAGTREVSVAA